MYVKVRVHAKSTPPSTYALEQECVRVCRVECVRSMVKSVVGCVGWSVCVECGSGSIECEGWEGVEKVVWTLLPTSVTLFQECGKLKVAVQRVPSKSTIYNCML